MDSLEKENPTLFSSDFIEKKKKNTFAKTGRNPHPSHYSSISCLIYPTILREK